LVFDEIATPEPGPGDVPLHLHASAVNQFDLHLRRGYFRELVLLLLPVWWRARGVNRPRFAGGSNF